VRITRKQLRQMINEELLREADLGEGSVEILGRLNRIESKLDDILQAVRPGGLPQRDIDLTQGMSRAVMPRDDEGRR